MAVRNDLTAEDLVAHFRTAWALPKPEPFIAYFEPLLHPNVVMLQPTLPPAHGPAGFAASFRGLFGLIPDLTATVDTWADKGSSVFIASTARGTLGGRPIGFEVCDRFELADGLILRRQAFFDPAPLLRAAAVRPRAWRSAVALLTTRH
ncbi:nuclear transport factor 2 family protein [Embleya sp. NBC_00896]|uniref:nuclear transport factor 2 family protein n=1 Tax=Embleya sp. NBC_00896 TaxID=2975961 RepID=UPI00386625F5|nr:nuclear transport factor 2 family protein [Embleya sp. NBC_00896]